MAKNNIDVDRIIIFQETYKNTVFDKPIISEDSILTRGYTGNLMTSIIKQTISPDGHIGDFRTTIHVLKATDSAQKKLIGPDISWSSDLYVAEYVMIAGSFHARGVVGGLYDRIVGPVGTNIAMSHYIRYLAHLKINQPDIYFKYFT